MVKKQKTRQPRSARRPRFFFFNDTATTEIYTLSLHDALPILPLVAIQQIAVGIGMDRGELADAAVERDVRQDRKSTRLNSSHPSTSYAVFCLKKKKKNKTITKKKKKIKEINK